MVIIEQRDDGYWYVIEFSEINSEIYYQKFYDSFKDAWFKSNRVINFFRPY